MGDINSVATYLQRAINDFLLKVGVVSESQPWDKAIVALGDTAEFVNSLQKQKPAVFISGATVIVGKKIRSYVQLAQEHKNSNGHYKPGDVLDTSNVVSHGLGYVETRNTVYVLTATPGTGSGVIEVINVYEDKAP